MRRLSKTLGFRLGLLGLMAPALLGLSALLAPNNPGLALLGTGMALAVSLGISAGIARILGRIGDTLRALDEDPSGGFSGSALRRGLGTDLERLTHRLEQSRCEMQGEIEQATSDLRETMEALEISNVELDLARQRALAAGKAKSEFLANMSHEIWTPLNGITGFANLMIRTRLSDEQREYMEAIARSSRDLVEIVDDILDFSKLEAGKLDVDSQAFDLRGCIDEAVAFMAPQAHAKGLELVAMIYNDLPERLVGDPSRIRQILTNLVSNAVKFTAEGEIVVRAMLVDQDDASCRLEISISDTGIGITPAARAGLFQPFSQGGTQIHRLYGGTGLGLSICQKLVQSMSGSIDVDTAEGRGSVFRFDLLLRKSESRKAPLARSAGLAGRRVAVFDTHHLSRASLRGRLEHAGLRPQTYQDTGSLIQAVTAESHPVVLGLSARAFRSGRAASLVGSLKQQGPVPVLLLLSTSNRAELEYGLRSGADICRSKPISDAGLQDALSELLHTPDAGMAPLRPRLEKVPVPSLAHCHFLVADDNPINLKLISTLLAASGAHVTRATDGEEVLELMDTVRFDLLLLDVQMPRMDGLELARAIRRRAPSAGGRIPILGLTADASAGNRAKAREAGMDDCLAKPTDERQLWYLVGRLLGVDIQAFADAASRDSLALAESARSEPPPSRDHQDATRITGGDPHLAEEIFRMLIAALPEQLRNIRDSLTRRDWPSLRERVHGLKGTTAICAVPALHASVGSLMECTRREDYDQAFSWLERVEREAGALRATADPRPSMDAPGPSPTSATGGHGRA
jgi:two-component system sensor histidine kinase BarA